MGVLGAVARWWDGVELWLTGLSFPLQVTIVLVVLLPLAAFAARALDKVATTLTVRPVDDDDTGPAPDEGGRT
ncbi:MAG: hypothetical protein ABI181_08385 [Mycobacteriaceae bacterium]